MIEGFEHHFLEEDERELDPTRLDFNARAYTPSATKITGVFPWPMTRQEVETQIAGSFGGRFETFDAALPGAHGSFCYIAYSD